MVVVMDTTVSTMNRTAPNRHHHFKCLSVVLIGLSSMQAHGAEFQAGVDVGISYLDNVYLAPPPNEIGDTAFQASPWINFDHTSPTLDANLKYQVNWFKYQDLDTTESFGSGGVSITGKTWQESLQLEVGASKIQVLSDPNGVVPPGQLPLSGNLTDRDEWYVTPSLNRNLGRSVALQASYWYAESRYSESDVQTNSNENAAFDLNNYDNGQGLTWALGYDWRRTDYQDTGDWEYQRAGAELGFWVNESLRFFGSGGKESAWDDPTDPALADPFWEAGFAYQAGEKISALLAAGERTFGQSWRGNLEYTFRRGSTSISYAQTPTTTEFGRSYYPGNALDPDDLDDFLDAPGSDQRYISNRLQWNMTLQGRRTGFSLALFNEDRTDRTEADGTPLPDESQQGMQAQFNWQAGVRTEFVLSGSFASQETSPTDGYDYTYAGLEANYRIGTRSQLSLSYNYSDQKPNAGSTSGRDYTANIVSLIFSISTQ